MPTSRGERARGERRAAPAADAVPGAFLTFERGGVVRLVVVLTIGLCALLGPRVAHAERTGADFTDSVELTTTLRTAPGSDAPAPDPADGLEPTAEPDPADPEPADRDLAGPTEPTDPAEPEPSVDPLPASTPSADEPPVASWFVSHRWARQQAVVPGG